MKTELAVILAFCLVSSALGCGGYDFEIPNPQPLSYYNKTLHLNIHLIPHTHDDMGWLKTVDQYYFGIWSNITNAGVQYILDSVHGSIAADTDRRFVLVEVGFFARWWKDLKEGARSVFRRTLAEGRIEFANGGWTMNDEACVYYEDSIDQMTLGHQFLLNTFGITPKVGWHIDPFGHANAQAAMFAQMGFHTFFISRIDYQDKNNRMNNSALEFIWIPETSQGDENAIFTHTTYYHYGDPRNFCWDQRCNFETIVDDPNLPGAYNVERWSDGYIAWFRQESNVYRSTEILHTIGNDFAYQASTYNFKNLERLFNFINNHPEKYNVHIGYSLPSTYINTINKLNITYPYKYDDMFPYADMKDAYWTGYFTSRPAIKGLIRRTGKFLQAMKKMLTQAVWLDSSPYVRANWTAVNTALNALEEAQATAQHHDAITGTQKQFVVYDYQNQIFSGITKLKNAFIYPYLAEATKRDLGLNNLQFSTCTLNMSSTFCSATYTTLPKGKAVLMAVYNPAQTRTSVMRVKVPNGNAQVYDVRGNRITTDVVCANITDVTDCDVFFTTRFNGSSLNYFYLEPAFNTRELIMTNLTFNKPYRINDEQFIQASSYSDYQLIVTKNGVNHTFNFSLSYRQYFSNENDWCGGMSGAYIFRPTSDQSSPYSQFTSASIVIGQNLLQIRIIGSATTTNMRIYNDISKGIEIETFVNSLPYNSGSGVEVILVVNSPNITNNKTFYTDSMGMEMQKRIINYRPSWKLNPTQYVSGNYYPVTAAIYIKDVNSGVMMGLMPDRAQGGASLAEGQIELMVHRRITRDDARGVGEALNEVDWDNQGLRQLITHKLFISNFAGIQTDFRMLQYHDDQPNIAFLAPTELMNFMPKFSNYLPQASLGDFNLDYIKVLSRAYNYTTIMYRFHNMDEKNSRAVPVSVFQTSAYGKATVTEMSLSFNQPKAEMIKNKLNWNGKIYNNPAFINNDYLTKDYFTLRPLEIRTFKVELPPKQTTEEFLI